MNPEWSKTELDVIVADYFSMLVTELGRGSFSKADHRRKILPLLNNRTEGSIEYKYQNISAALISLGLPYIEGYKPAWNYQRALVDHVIDYVKSNLSLEKDFREFAERTIQPETDLLIFKDMKVEAPVLKESIAEEAVPIYNRPTNVNYLEIEQNNKQLGTYGEEIVIKYEKWRLIEAGKDSLADQIEWVSLTRGDWAGFDILSKNTNGTGRYIEVKTTKLGKDTPIFFTKNEYDFSIRNVSNYFLYRLFNSNKKPKLFIKNGNFDDICRFQPVKFKGYF